MRNMLIQQMTVHVAANSGCNIGCEYCYESPDRELHKGGAVETEYDIERIMERLEEIKEDPNITSTPGLHGGEPTLLKNEDLERIFKWIYENYNEGGHIQTNGTLIDDELIEIFEKYEVGVGISKDGPEELNYLRKAKVGGEDATEEIEKRIQHNFERLMKSDASVGVIVVLHEGNAGTDERLEKLLDWMDWMNRQGASGHFNPANPYQDRREEYILSAQRVKEVWIRTWEWMLEEPYRRWDPMTRFADNLLGFKLTNCVNNRCDIFNTQSATIVKGDGETSGCAKGWSIGGDGGGFLQGRSADNYRQETEERYQMLKQVPGPYTEEVQNGEVTDQGGCKGCEYWSLCYGGCPAGPVGKEYRNRARLCAAKHGLYERIEQDLRRLFPGIRLITDKDWDEETHRVTPNAHIKSFGSVSWDYSNYGVPSVMGEDSVRESVSELIEKEKGHLKYDRRIPFTKRVELVKKEVNNPEEVKVDYKNRTIEVPAGQRQRARGDD